MVEQELEHLCYTSIIYDGLCANILASTLANITRKEIISDVTFC